MRLSAIATLLLAAATASAAELPADKLLELPAFRKLVPAGTVAGLPQITTAPVLVNAAGVRTGPEGARVLRVALVVLEKPTTPVKADGPLPRRTVTLIIARQEGKSMVTELVRKRTALGAHSVTLAPVRPGAQPAVAMHWAESAENHSGLLEVWSLGDGKPELSWTSEAEGFYFENDQAGAEHMVLYAPEPDSLVFLPRILGWRGGKLEQTTGTDSAVASRLLQDYDEVLRSYVGERTGAEPPRMVVDVALSRARLLERLGRAAEALTAYRSAATLVPSAAGAESQDEDHKENALRAAEATRRAATLQASLGTAPAGK